MKNILVVGGSTGIGQSLVGDLCSEYNVYSTYNKNIQSDFTNVTYQKFDVMHDSIEDLPLPDVIDGLVYCPGSIVLKPFHRISEEEIIDDLRLNVTGFLKILKAIRKNLMKSEQASIVLFSSVAANSGFPFHTQVAISKGAIESLTRTLAAELSPKMRVNAIAPSLTKTPLSSSLLNSEAKIDINAQRHPLQAIGDVSDISKFAKHLISSDSKWITGQIFTIDGGISSIRK